MADDHWHDVKHKLYNDQLEAYREALARLQALADSLHAAKDATDKSLAEVTRQIGHTQAKLNDLIDLMDAEGVRPRT